MPSGPGRFCRSCYTDGQLHEVGRVPAVGGKSLSTASTATAVSAGLRPPGAIKASGEASVIEPYLRKVTCQQLFFANLRLLDPARERSSLDHKWHVDVCGQKLNGD